MSQINFFDKYDIKRILIRVYCQNFTSIALIGRPLEGFENFKRDFPEFFGLKIFLV